MSVRDDIEAATSAPTAGPKPRLVVGLYAAIAVLVVALMIQVASLGRTADEQADRIDAVSKSLAETNHDLLADLAELQTCIYTLLVIPEDLRLTITADELADICPPIDVPEIEVEPEVSTGAMTTAPDSFRETSTTAHTTTTTAAPPTTTTAAPPTPSPVEPPLIDVSPACDSLGENVPLRIVDQLCGEL